MQTANRCALTVLLWTLVTVAVAAEDPFTGTWILDRQASQGGAKSQVLTITVSENRESYRSELMQADGTRQVTHYTAAYDGREYPSETTVTHPDGTRVRSEDSVILRKIDLQTRERYWRRNGRVIRILRRTVSPDDHLLTSKVIDVDSSGQEHVVGSLVFNHR
jgi:hypothetical protein